MRKLMVGIAGAVAALTLAGSAAAQETGTPVFKSPYRTYTSSEVGATLSDPGGSGWALEGFYGYGHDRWDIGFRGGFLDTPGKTRLLAGVSARTRVLQSSQSFPLDGALTLGAGLNFNDGTFAFIPIGISLGRRVMLENSDVTFVPYVHPVMIPAFGNGIGDDGGDSNIFFALGLGVDIKFTNSLDVRVSGALGDSPWDGVSVGLAFIH
jgi:opacity protein-like surface antigen